MPFEQFKEFTRTEKRAGQNLSQNDGNVSDEMNAVGAINAGVDERAENGAKNDVSKFLRSPLKKYVEYGKTSDEEQIETLFKSDDESDVRRDDFKSGGEAKAGESTDFDDEYYGFKKALDEFNEELKSEAEAENKSGNLLNGDNDVNGDNPEKPAYKSVIGTYSGEKSNDDGLLGDTETEIEAARISGADYSGGLTESENVADKKGSAEKASGVEPARYRNEFNEFRYARYMGAVVADMRNVYNFKELAAALGDFEKDKFSVYAVNLRQIERVNELLKKAEREHAAGQKKSFLSVVGAGAYVKKTGDGGGFAKDGVGASSKQKTNRPKICVCIGDENGGTALNFLVKEIRYARRNGADEIDVCVSPEAVLAPDAKTLKNEIKTLKRAAGKAVLKIGVNLNVLTDLQAETLMSAASSLKITAFVLRGDLAAEKIKRLKSFAPHCKTEITSPIKTTSELNDALDSGADRVYTTEFIPLAACVRGDLESVELG